MSGRTAFETFRARDLVSKALRDGTIEHPAACESCGCAQKLVPWRGFLRHFVEWHHPDYRQPFWLVGLCPTCHAAVHAGRKPEPQTGRWYLRLGRSRSSTPVDVVRGDQLGFGFAWASLQAAPARRRQAA